MIPGDEELWLAESIHHELLITDGTVTVSGTNYTVSGATVTFTNALIDEESLQVHQSLCSEQQIRYGSCESNSVEFTINENVTGLKGKTIKIYLIPDYDASKMLLLGSFKIAEDTLSDDRTKRHILAWDKMYDILNADVADWYNTLLPTTSSSVTMAQFRASFLSHFGITAESGTLVNDSMTIKRTVSPETLSAADVIKAICEINGVFGTITNEGKFRFRYLEADLDSGLFPADDLYPANDLYPEDVNHSVGIIQRSQYIHVKYEDWLSEGITQLRIRTDKEDIGVTVGTPGNTYIITGNFLVYGYNATNLTTVANNILSRIGGCYYRPATVEAVGNPLREVGDGIRIRTQYRGIVTYVLERTLSGVQALKDTYIAEGTEYFNEQLNSNASRFEQVANKTLKLKADVDGVSAELTEQLDDTVYGSYAYMTSQEIGLKVSKDNIVDDLDAQMSGITITPSSIAISSGGTFSVDSSNFRLASDGSLTIRNVTFDSTGQGATDMVINNGVISGGSVEIGHSIITVGSGEFLSYMSSGIVQASVQIDLGYGAANAVTLTALGNKLYVNNQEVNTGGLPSTISCTSLDASYMVTAASGIVIGSLSDPQVSFIYSSGQICIGGHQLSYYTVEDVNGVRRNVLGY